MTDNKCKYILADGTQCGAYAIHNEDFCFNHHPDWKDKKHLAVVKGGASKEIVVETPLQKITVNTPKDVITLLSQTISEVRDGTLDVRVATGIGFLAGHLLKAFEVSELNEKTEEVKDIIAQIVKEREREREKNLYGR